MPYFAHASDPQPARSGHPRSGSDEGDDLHQHAYARVQQEQLSSRTSEIERLVLLVEKLQRMLFGAKSEKVFRQIKQLELQLEGMLTTFRSTGSRRSTRAREWISIAPRWLDG